MDLDVPMFWLPSALLRWIFSKYCTSLDRRMLCVSHRRFSQWCGRPGPAPVGPISSTTPLLHHITGECVDEDYGPLFQWCLKHCNPAVKTVNAPRWLDYAFEHRKLSICRVLLQDEAIASIHYLRPDLHPPYIMLHEYWPSIQNANSVCPPDYLAQNMECLALLLRGRPVARLRTNLEAYIREFVGHTVDYAMVAFLVKWRMALRSGDVHLEDFRWLIQQCLAVGKLGMCMVLHTCGALDCYRHGYRKGELWEINPSDLWDIARSYMTGFQRFMWVNNPCNDISWFTKWLDEIRMPMASKQMSLRSFGFGATVCRPPSPPCDSD